MTFSKKFGLRANVVEKDYVLVHQMADLPEFELFWNEIETIMEWLNKGKE